jgi:hypothetical protein
MSPIWVAELLVLPERGARLLRPQDHAMSIDGALSRARSAPASSTTTMHNRRPTAHHHTNRHLSTTTMHN